MARCRLATYADGVRVLESERRQPTHAEAIAKRVRNVPERLVRRATRGVAEDGEQTGAGVLGIDVDRVRANRGERDFGGAESRTAVDAKAARLEQLREHLAEDVRLAERLRRDDDRPGAGNGLRHRKRQRKREGRVHDAALAPTITTSARRAPGPPSRPAARRTPSGPARRSRAAFRSARCVQRA